MPSISSSYRGPMIVIGLGGGFSVVGAVPVAITFSIGVKTSATVIGMGFVTFGFLLMLPGFFWCVVVRTDGFKACCYCCLRKKLNEEQENRRKKRNKKWRHEDDEEDEDDDDDDEDDDSFEEQPALSNYQENRQTECEKHWPSHVYLHTPALLITSSDSYKNLNSSECLQLQQMNDNSTPHKTTAETDDEKTTTSIMQHSIDSGQHTPSNDEHENVKKMNQNSIPHKNNVKSELPQKSADSDGKKDENRGAYENKVNFIEDHSTINPQKDSADIEKDEKNLENIGNHINTTTSLKNDVNENELDSQNAAQTQH